MARCLMFRRFMKIESSNLLLPVVFRSGIADVKCCAVFTYLREELARIEVSWVAPRFDSLPHVVHILTSKDREGEVQILKDQNDIIEEVVDEVVHAYHTGFNKAIQNYSQILRLFSESAESIKELKVDLAEAKRRLGTRNKQLHQLWYRSVTLRHIISLLDQIEGIAKVPARIEKLIAGKQYYAAVQLHAQSALMLEREGLQTVGALQDVRSELTKLRGVLFYKVLEDLHAHLYNRGEYSSAVLSMHEMDDEVPTTVAVAYTTNNSQPLSRRTRLKGDNQFGVHGLADGSHSSTFDGHDEDGSLEAHDETSLDGLSIGWLANSTPDEFVEAIRKSDAPLHVKYLQTMVECLCILGKVAAAGAIICQRLRPTIHEIITSKIKAHAQLINSSRSAIGQAAQTGTTGLHFMKGQLRSYQLPKQKRQNGISLSGTLLAVSPVSALMAPMGKAQAAAKELLDSILDSVVRIFENHVVVGELLESRSSRHDINTPKSMIADANWNPDSEASVTGGYSIGFSMTVLQSSSSVCFSILFVVSKNYVGKSECQQLICEILRATPEAASADAAVQTARLAKDGLTFAFRFTDATISIPNQGADLIRQGWSRRGTNVLQEGYGTAAVLPEQGIYLAASIYRPVLQFTDKVASMLPQKYSQLGGILTGPAAFRPRAHTAATYVPSIEKGRPVLQGLLAIDFLAKEASIVLGWAQAMPKFAADLVKYVQTFLERTYERCRTSYMEAVLEKQSYMLIGRHDIDKLLRLEPASASLPNGQLDSVSSVNDAETPGVESELSELFLSLRPIRQTCHSTYSLVGNVRPLLDAPLCFYCIYALVFLATIALEIIIIIIILNLMNRLGQATLRESNLVEESRKPHHNRSSSAPSRDLASFADEYRKLAIDCLKVLRVEMQLETIFHLQEMTSREYLEDQDAEEPDDFIISLTSQITRRDEEMAPFIAEEKRNYIFGGICGIAANASIKALADMKNINLFGVQQICRNSIALEQALAAIPSIDSDAALLAFVTEHENLFTTTELVAMTTCGI
ncbi:exocyst complex component SEC8 [Citrus sinensis]|uniref:Exocyst complex component SEC8 n=2 Tax=Citrus sinensis TaxID=2711 RepID=A0ACB8L4Y2_CITSI|nr:exocyst complex component SEC8 [Citrus sinensis]KAH9768514.1 exocyst complex component SEC8 [Citrus sinensis]